jgi:hypothetical protein
MFNVIGSNHSVSEAGRKVLACVAYVWLPARVRPSHAKLRTCPAAKVI